MLQNDLRIALRNLRKNPLVSSLNISGLAIGVAVCLFIGVWVYRELSYDNFHPDADRIFRVVNTFQSESESFSQAPSGPALGAHLPEELPEVEAGCRLRGGESPLSVGDKQFFEEDVLTADTNFFLFFHFPLLQGSPSSVFADLNSIVLTESTARKYFGQENPVGKTLKYRESTLLTVSGVAADPPANSQIRFNAVMPMTFLKQWALTHWDSMRVDEQWVGGWMQTYLRLRNPAEWKDAEQHINTVVAEHSKKEWTENNMRYTYTLQPLRSIHLESNLRYDMPSNGSLARVWVFGAIGLIVLLLACINYTNLATVSAMNRAKETGVRKAIGAGRTDLMRQFLTDSITLSLLSTALGAGLVALLLPAFSDLTEQPFSMDWSLQNCLLLFGFSLVIGLLSGLYPAFVLSAFKPAATLKGAVQNKLQGAWLRQGLVVFQFATTVALLAGIFIIREQMSFIQSEGLGFRGDAVIEVDYRGAEKVDKGFGALRNQLLQSAVIKNVSMHAGNVVGGLGNGWTTTEDLDGKEISTSAYAYEVDAEYFDTYGMQLAAGRFFSKDYPTDTLRAVLVNEAAVRTFGWKTPENALGKRFGKGKQQKQVVGVIRDFHFESLHKPVEALILHFARGGNAISLKVDQAQAKAAIHHLETTWKQQFPEIPLDYAFVDSKVAQQYGNERRLESLFLLLSALSLFIACLGLFGLAAYAAQQRTKEIGIRKVLGASIVGISGLLAKDFLKLVLIGILIASPLAWYFMQKWLNNFAYHIDMQWWMFAGAGVAAILIALLTVGFQSIKTALANPVKSLRSE